MVVVMANWIKRKPTTLVGIGLGIGLMVGTGMMVGTLCGLWSGGPDEPQLPELVLHAEGATGCSTMAIATGVVDEDAEGLFTLDFLTGELSCFVIYTKGPLAQQLGAVFKANVAKTLGGVQQGKKPHYLMVTGKANFLRGGATNVRPAFCVCYVVDTNSGKWVAYGIRWNSMEAARGNRQQDEMVPLATGNVRSGAIREQP
jgi:hypothetical protein